MAYIGKGIENLSSRTVLDSITASATATYNLLLNSVAYVPSSAESLTVSLNGVIQKPQSSYTVSGSTIVFDSALTSSDVIDFILAERAITLTTVGSGSVGTSQLVDGSVSNAKLANSSITLNGSAVSLGGSATIGGGKVLQFVNGVYSTETSITSSTLADTGMSLSITPTSSSSKIFVIFQCMARITRSSNAEAGAKFKLLRDATSIWDASPQTFYIGAGGSSWTEHASSQVFTYYDSPATTSSINYKLQGATNGSGHTLKAQASSSQSQMTLMEIGA